MYRNIDSVKVTKGKNNVHTLMTKFENGELNRLTSKSQPQALDQIRKMVDMGSGMEVVYALSGSMTSKMRMDTPRCLESGGQRRARRPTDVATTIADPLHKSLAR